MKHILKKRRDDVLRVAARRGARNVRMFGSVVREEERSDSDIDFLVVLDDGISLLDVVRLERELGEILERKVEIVDERALSPYIRDNVLLEAIVL